MVEYDSNLSNEILIEESAEYGIILEKSYTMELIYAWLKDDANVSNLKSVLNPIWGEKLIYFTYSQKKVVVISAKGASVAGNAVERLKRTGVKYIVSIGTCGSTNEFIVDGTFLIIAGAVRGDAVTQGYLGIEVPALADTEMVNKLLNEFKKEHITAIEGLIYTTDNRYQEDSKMLKELNERANVLAVDMETSAVLLISKYHKIKATSIKIVTDCAVKKTDGQLKGIFDRNKNFIDFVHPKLKTAFYCVLSLYKHI